MGPRPEELPDQFQNAQAPGQRLHFKRHRELRPHDGRVETQPSPARCGPGLARPPQAHAFDKRTQDGKVGTRRHRDVGIEHNVPRCQRFVRACGQPDDWGRGTYGRSLSESRPTPATRPTLGHEAAPRSSYRLCTSRTALAQDHLMTPTHRREGQTPDHAGIHHRILGDAQRAKRQRGS